ncbi:PQQ-binding-like beta-propeller repeat protein, partial [Candidatus Woesearchaeota archaeon]|nr:PQQ-binding-like beta-propeller repeat protein [Candidatus Woesearchaeota archaeon]
MRKLILFTFLLIASVAHAEEQVMTWSYSTASGVWTVSMSSDGKYIAAGSYDNHVYFFDSAGKLLWKYKASDEIWDVAMSSRGEYVAAGSRDSNVYFFNSSGNLLSKYKTAYYVSSVATSEDGNYTVAGSYDNNVYFFKKMQPVVEVPKLPKLSAAKSAANPVVVEGDSTAVDIKIQNLGEGKASKVHFKDSIPQGLELAEGSTEWSGELKSGESISISYKLRAAKLAIPENATYQLPKLEVTYEDASLNIYTATAAPIFITVVPKEAEPVKPPPISLYALIAAALPYVVGILLVVWAVLIGRKLRRIVTKERVLYPFILLKSASTAVSQKTAKIAVEGRAWLKNIFPSFILRIKGMLEGVELRELRGIYLSLPYKTKNPRELLGMSTAVISGAGAYERRLAGAGFATIRDLAGADVSEV